MSRLLATLLFVLLAFSGVSSPARATEYLSGISDLPLPDGLVEAKDKSTVFDSAVGKVVTAYASGPGTADAVHDFYEATLPQLGWTETDEGNWRRENETLKIDVLGPAAGPVTATFTLSSDN
ncbi:MAG: hypothetical protein IPK59_15765 [Rhodospirillaceae bacterium]|nr:hypothetical protein [Rhodospirillaceae bacterium]